MAVADNAPCLSFTPDPRITEEVTAALLMPDAPALWAAWAAPDGRYSGKPGA